MLFSVGFIVTLAVVGWPRWRKVRLETEAMADAHLAYRVAHPGWSFPARIWSAPAPLDLPLERRLAHARARGYAEACPPTTAGSMCPETGDVLPRSGDAFEPVLLGHLIGPDAEIRERLTLAEAPPHLVAAILAAEDDAFYDHPGVNPRGVARATWVALRGGGKATQGASTISMQVVRNLSERKERSLHRKVHEMMAAVALDRHLGKDKVLEVYLNAPYLGQHGSFSICGFQAASRYYYGVEAAELTLSQAATLASILPAPGRFAPDRHPDAARARRDRTLERMAELGWPRAAVDAALAEPVTATPHPPPDPIHPSYLQATRSWLADHLDEESLYGAGLDVYTAMDVVAQRRSEAVVADSLRFLEKTVGRQGEAPLEAAVAVVSPETGLLVATWGGTQDLATDFNRATQAKRQSGSSIKPLVYALAFSQTGPDGRPKWRAHHTVRNDRHVFKGTDGWFPRNVGGQYSAESTLAMALAWSQNVATASLLEALGGPSEMIGFARRLGFTTEGWREEMGLALGTGEVTPLEMADFVATVLGEGRLATGRPVITAVDAAGVARIGPPEPQAQVLSPEAAALTRDLMRLVIEYGTGGAARGAAGRPGLQHPAVGKTGTTDSEKDLWFVGGTADYAGALWIGYDQPRRIGASASDLAAPLWGWWMRALHEGLEKRELGGSVKTRGRGVCRETGDLPNATCILIGAPFLEGDKPSGTCDMAHAPPVEGDKKYEGLWKRKEREANEAAGG